MENMSINRNVILLLLLIQSAMNAVFVFVEGAIVISYKEGQCLMKTGDLFNRNAPEELLLVRHDFSTSAEMAKTSKHKMSVTYNEEKLGKYDELCSKHGGKLHKIELEYFDCLVKGAPKKEELELKVKNFANCLADIDECNDFGQENLLEEAWEAMGLHCLQEDEETMTDDEEDDDSASLDDDLAKTEKEKAAEGADEVDREEKKAEYVPRDERGGGSDEKKKGGGGFTKFLLFVAVCGAGYFLYDRRRRGVPIEFFSSSDSSFSYSPSFFERIASGFSSIKNRVFRGRQSSPYDSYDASTPEIYLSGNYNLLSSGLGGSSGGEEGYAINNDLHLSSNLTA